MTRRVLLTTEDQVARTDYQPFLESFGYEVESVEDGLGCYQKLRQEPPDILILEWNLERGDVADGVVEAMRDNPEWYAIPVILISEESNPHSRDRAIDDPIVACLCKPFSLSDLLKNILLADGYTYKAFVEKP